MNSAAGRARLFKFFLLVALASLLVYAVLFQSTPIAQADRQEREHRNIMLLAVGILGLVATAYPGRRWAPTTGNRGLFSVAALLPAYTAFQLIPLPLAVLHLLSPPRLAMLDALSPLSLRPAWASLSIAPSLTLVHFLLSSCYAVIFFVVCDAARSSAGTPWLFVLPILGVAAWQGVWGVSQFFDTDGANVFAHGSYAIRNHFAGSLEMSLPLAIAYGAAGFRLTGPRGKISIAAGSRVAAGFIAAGIIFAGIFYSLSRMGLVAMAGSLIVMAILGVAVYVPGRRKYWIMLASAVGLVLLSAMLAPIPLVLRFAQDSTEGRFEIWRDTIPLIAAYPIFGCGLGGYEAAFTRFQTTGVEFVTDYAHNDYLQFLSELGVLGGLIAAAFILWICSRAVRTAVRHHDANQRWLGLGCCGALAAILIHSSGDFNLYVPANALLLAWICGLAAALERPALVSSPV